MILTKLMGGLGNQMFQYAAARSLACRHKTEVKLDLSFLNQETGGAYTQRRYELDVFDLPVRIAGPEDFSVFKAKSNNKITRFVHRNFPFLSNNIHVVERGSLYHPEFKDYPSNTYLEGFWQSEKYFQDFKDQIRNDFKPKQTMPASLEPVLKRILGSNSISVHVRRGDYVNLKSASSFHGSCSVEYYQKAVDFISNKKQQAELFVFSDDLDWCKTNLAFSQPVTYVTHSDHPYWDMHLMSKCRNNIIANSSFSWWGAWLNNDPGRIVIVPEHWFVGVKSESIDIVANNWKVL
jgi:hypothetical protein